MSMNACHSDTGLNQARLNRANSQLQAEANALAFRDCMVHGIGILKTAYDGNAVLQEHVKRSEFLQSLIDTMYTAAIPRETITAVKPELLTQRVRDW